MSVLKISQLNRYRHPVNLLRKLPRGYLFIKLIVKINKPLLVDLLIRLAHKSSAKREPEICYVFGGKASEKAGDYYRNRKREAKDFEKV